MELVTMLALVPFLLYSSTSKSPYWWIKLYSTLLIANLINLLWLSSTVTIGQYISFAIILAFLQTIPFIVFKKIDKLSTIAFISSWLVIEYFLLHSEVNYPMSLLGLPLASYPQLIQWWEFTGILG
ncbi:MAG: hypothetical protein MGG11_23250, partial [Trichodesmium sp. MAG_R03]|nr:hypothetical protein [Trichodesmium sp. MAG_R03]